MRPRGYLTVGLALLALCSVGVASANEAPQAEAGLDQDATVNTTVYLDAGGSVDPDGRIDEYEWSIETPDGTTRTPDCETCPTTWFVPTQDGQYNVTIRVIGDSGSANEDTLYVNVEGVSVPGGGSSTGGTVGPGGPAVESPGALGASPGLSDSGGGSGDGNDAILTNVGGESSVVAGTVEPWDTVEISVAGDENLEIPGEDFIQAADSPGRAPLNEFTAEMSELGISPADVENSMTANSVRYDYESAPRIETRTLNQQMESLNDNLENSALSGLQTIGDDSNTDTPDEGSWDGSSSNEWNTGEDDANSDSDISYSPTSSSDSAAGGGGGSAVDTGDLDGVIGPIGPNP